MISLSMNTMPDRIYKKARVDSRHLLHDVRLKRGQFLFVRGEEPASCRKRLKQ